MCAVRVFVLLCAKRRLHASVVLASWQKSTPAVGRARGHEVSRRQDAFANRCGSRRFGDSSADGLRNARGRRATRYSQQHWPDGNLQTMFGTLPCISRCSPRPPSVSVIKISAARCCTANWMRCESLTASSVSATHSSPSTPVAICAVASTSTSPAFLDKREDMSGRNRVRRRSATAGLRRKVPQCCARAARQLHWWRASARDERPRPSTATRIVPRSLADVRKGSYIQSGGIRPRSA